jgi:hypothetical protein
MKKVYLPYMITGLIFFTILLGSTTTLAWSNGKFNAVQAGTPGNLIIQKYKNDYLRSIPPNTQREYYGTHDWVAESALELLYSVQTHPFLSKLWDINNPDNLRVWYLVGTELPDSAGNLGSKDNALKTRCDNRFKSSDFNKRNHQRLYFDELYGFPIDDSAAQAANAFYLNIKKAFQKRDCQTAAVYIGALMHIITDASFYGHLIKGIPSGSYRSIWAHMDHVTFRTWMDVNGDRSNEFFNIAEALGAVSASIWRSPYLATIRVGSDTYYGNYYGSPSIRDADWLYSKQPSVANRKYWNNIQGPWQKFEDQHTWTHSMRPNDPNNPDPRDYFNTLEHNLNKAIYFCATTLNYVLSFGGYSDCECSGENPPSKEEQPDPTRKDGVKDGVQQAQSEIMGLLFFNMVGLISTAIALTVSHVLKNFKLLEKILKPIT